MEMKNMDLSTNEANGAEGNTVYSIKKESPSYVFDCVVPFVRAPEQEEEPPLPAQDKGELSSLKKNEKGRFVSSKKDTVNFPDLLKLGMKEIDWTVEPIKVGSMNSRFYAPNIHPAFYVNLNKEKAEGKRLKDNYAAGGMKAVWDDLKGNKTFQNCISKWSLASNALLVADMCGGILRALTGGDAYNNFFVAMDGDLLGGEGFIKLTATPLQLAKATLGGCMTTTGIKRSLYEPLKEAGIIQDFLNLCIGDDETKGREPMLNCFDETGMFLSSYKPLMFSGFDKEGYLTILLDKRFFSFQVKEGMSDIVCKDRFIPSFAGLYALCVVGRYFLLKENSKKNPGLSLPRASSVAKLYHALQASYNVQSLIGFSKEYEMTGDKGNKVITQIRLNNAAVYSLFPSCCKINQNWINWKKASSTIALAGNILYKGLEVTGMLDEKLPGSDQLLLIKPLKAAYFEGPSLYVGCESLADIQKEREASKQQIKK